MSEMYLVIFSLKFVSFSVSRVLARDPDSVGSWGRLPQNVPQRYTDYFQLVS